MFFAAPPDAAAPPPEVPADAFDLALLLGGAVVLGIAAFHGRITRTAGLSGPLLATLAGAAVGPAALGWLDPAAWGGPAEVMRPAALLTLAVGVAGVALRLPRGCVLTRAHLVTAAVLLGPAMLAMWAASWGLAWGVLGLPVWVAGLVAACVVPTDPVLASAVVSGKFAREHLPDRLRHAISFESGANDGLAAPFVALAAAGVAGSLDTAGGWGEWFAAGVLGEAGLALLIGGVAGPAAAWLLRLAERHHDLDETGLLAFALALAFVVLGACGAAGEVLGVPPSGALATFAAVLSFAWLLRGADRREEAEITDAVNQFFLLPVFGLFGAALPWGEWAAFGWRGPAFAAAVLLVRRPPWVWLLGRLAPDLRAPRDRLFAGWFGPIGVAALFYASDRAGEAAAVWPAVSLVVAASTLAHGATAAPLTRAYSRARS